MVVRFKNLCALAGAALLFSHAAHADMWTFTDPQGVKHFASSQIDKRYALLFRGTPAPAAAEAPVASGSPSMEARVDYGVASAKSVAAMEISPGFMAVKQHMRTAADANQLDVALLQAVIHTESRFNPVAVSPKGAVGLMQVMPATAERYGLANDKRGTVSAKLTDPKTNIHTGARYLRDLVNMFPGQLELAVAAYNAGEGAVQKAGNKIPNFKETQNYVRSVMQLYQRLNPQVRTAPATVSASRVKAQFHSTANPNINLRWDEVNNGREPVQTGDLVITPTELSN